MDPGRVREPEARIDMDPVPLILRAPVGYYLPAAAVGSILGLASADIALYLWTVVGFALVLCAATTRFGTAGGDVVGAATSGGAATAGADSDGPVQPRHGAAVLGPER